MDVITGSEAKIRAWELPASTGIPPGARTSFDDPGDGAKGASVEQIIAAGVMRTPYAEGLPSADATVLVTEPNGTTSRRAYSSLTGALVNYYLGPHPTPPSTSNEGGPLVPGHSYYNSTDNNTYVFSIYGEWQLFGEPVPSSVRVYKYSIITSTTILPVLDDFGNSLDFDATRGDAVSLYVNGSRQVGGVDFILHTDATISLPVPAVAGNIIEVQVLARPAAVFTRQAIIINTSLWVLDGFTRTFDLQQSAGVFVSPGNGAACLVVQGAAGVTPVPQDPSTKFTVAGSKITFALAPSPGSTIWMVVYVINPQTRVTVERSAAWTMDPSYDGVTVSMRVGGVIIDVRSAEELGVGYVCDVIVPVGASAVTLRDPVAHTISVPASTRARVAVRTNSSGGLTLTAEQQSYVGFV